MRLKAIGLSYSSTFIRPPANQPMNAHPDLEIYFARALALALLAVAGLNAMGVGIAGDAEDTTQDRESTTILLSS